MKLKKIIITVVLMIWMIHPVVTGISVFAEENNNIEAVTSESVEKKVENLMEEPLAISNMAETNEKKQTEDTKSKATQESSEKIVSAEKRVVNKKAAQPKVLLWAGGNVGYTLSAGDTVMTLQSLNNGRTTTMGMISQAPWLMSKYKYKIKEIVFADKIKLGSSPWDKERYVVLDDMFASMNLEKITNIQNFDVTGATSMNRMFASSYSLTNLDLSSWNVSTVTSAEFMFQSAAALNELNLANWNVSNLKSMRHMFANLNRLEKLDLSGWNISKNTSISGMDSFSNLNNLSEIKLGAEGQVNSKVAGMEVKLPTANDQYTGLWTRYDKQGQKGFGNRLLYEYMDDKQNGGAGIYVWQKKPAKLIVNYLDENGKKIAGVQSQTVNGFVEDKYDVTTPVHQIVISNYTLDKNKLPENRTGTFSKNVIEVNYVYSKNMGNVHVTYTDKDQKTLAPSITIRGGVGDKYDVYTDEYNKKIEHYTWNGKKPANATGTFTGKDITVNYSYNKSSGSIVVNYRDENNMMISPSKILDGYSGEEYDVTTPEYQLSIPDYELKETGIPDNGKGLFTDTTQVVTYIYTEIPKLTVTSELTHWKLGDPINDKLVKAGLIVKYKDEILVKENYDVVPNDKFFSDDITTILYDKRYFTNGVDTVRTLPAKIRMKTAPYEQIETEIKIRVDWGNTIGFEIKNEAAENTGAAFRLLAGESPTIVASGGKNNTEPDNTVPTNKIGFEWFDLSNKKEAFVLEIGATGTESWENTGQKKQVQIETWGNTSNSQGVNNGDIVGAYNDYEKEGSNFIYEASTDEQFTKKWYSHNDTNWVYYQITQEGYKPLKVTNLRAEEVSLPYGASDQQQIDSLNDIFELNDEESLTVKGFVNKPNVTATGVQMVDVIVAETLAHNKVVEHIYKVKYTILPGVVEDYVTDGALNVKTERYPFDENGSYTPNPDTTVTYNKETLTYLGWVAGDYTIGAKLNKSKPETVTESASQKFTYVYGDPDKEINVTLPVRMLFANTENEGLEKAIESNTYHLKNNSEDYDVNVKLTHFEEVKNDGTRLLGVGDPNPQSEEEAIRLNLRINKNDEIKSLTSKTPVTDMGTIGSETQMKLKMTGHYFGDVKAQSKKYPQHKLNLKFTIIR